jgi:hypothetical protein
MRRELGSERVLTVAAHVGLPPRSHQHEPSSLRQELRNRSRSIVKSLRQELRNRSRSIVKSSAPGRIAPRLTHATSLAKSADSGLASAMTLAAAWVWLASSLDCRLGFEIYDSTHRSSSSPYGHYRFWGGVAMFGGGRTPGARHRKFMENPPVPSVGSPL